MWNDSEERGSEDEAGDGDVYVPDGARPRTPKSVSFHSGSCLPTRKVWTATDCIKDMVTGCTMIKVRNNSRQYHRYFSLNDDLTALRWTPTSKKSSKAQVLIDQIKEVRGGKNTDVLRNKEIAGCYSEDCALSILYGENFECVDLVAPTADKANIWITGLNALVGASKSPDAFTEKQTAREEWILQMFEEEVSEEGGFLDEEKTVQLMKRLNKQVTSTIVRQKLAEYDHAKSDSKRGRIDSKEFIDMFQEICTRPDIYFLLIRYAGKDYLTLDDLQLFLEGEQGMSVPTADKCREIVDKYEPTTEARNKGHLLIDGFTAYLLSDECDIFDPSHREVCQDMSQPLTEYFISTSHNTYLLEDQLKGPSSSEGYMRALTAGCRCIKVDCWDGVEGPVVFHGNTLTSKVPLREVLRAINKYTFRTSPYPLIIHLENHCSITQQRVIAEMLKSQLGDALYVHPPGSPTDITTISLEDLMGKFIIKSRSLSNNIEGDEGEVSEEDEGGGDPEVRRIRLCKELSDLISLSRTRFKDFSSSKHTMKPNECCSLSESSSARLAHASSEEFVNHNKQFLTRVYPNANRIDSSNYNPQDFWNCGCQMVALNFQTPGQMMDLYEGKFRQNGNCGYVLKPGVMREQVSCFSAYSKQVIPGVLPQVLRLKIISGQHLPRPRGSTARGQTVIDPYVLVQVFGIPADCIERKTRTVFSEGNSPIFDESFEFTINLPELALLRFVVLDDEYIGDDFIGQYTIPFECLQTGYRHIKLLSNTGETLKHSTLFVHLSITNKKGGGKPSKKKSKQDRMCADMRTVGIKCIDDCFKAITPKLLEAHQYRCDVEQASCELKGDCGLPDASNVPQCLRVLSQRLLSCSEVLGFNVVIENGLPMIKVVTPSLPAALHKSVLLFDKVLMEYHYFNNNTEKLLPELLKAQDNVIAFYEQIEALCLQAGIKGKKLNRVQENYACNVRVMKGQIDLLEACRKECKQALSSVMTTSQTFQNCPKDKSPTVRERPKLVLREKTSLGEGRCFPATPSPTRTQYGSLGRANNAPVSPSGMVELKPKSILKKSNSNIEQSSSSYRRDDEDEPADMNGRCHQTTVSYSDRDEQSTAL